MNIDLSPLADKSRLLFDIELRPVQGKRFQPTGFPGLGAAEFNVGTTKYVLVESAQSMANRFEAVCWDNNEQDLVSVLRGLSHITVNDKNGEFLTDSILEAHRLNSPYILENPNVELTDQIKKDLEVDNSPVSIPRFASVLLEYDANALVHGLFISKKDIAGGRYRLPRALSAFIEAEKVNIAASGGVKNDAVNPSGDTGKGFGNVPFSRDEYSAEKIYLYVNLDLTQLRGLRLAEQVVEMLILLSLYKLSAFINRGMRLRTACDFELVNSQVTSRDGQFHLPELSDIEHDLRKAIANCQSSMKNSEIVFDTSKLSKKAKK